MGNDLLIRGGTLVTPAGLVEADVAVAGGRIVAIGSDLGDAAESIDARGLHVLPGCIDTQVHFREPGLEHKENLQSGTASAALGGITAVFEMPNTNPNTDSAEQLADKVARAERTAHVDFAFFVGATADNAESLGALERLPGCCGIKMFMGSSTGTLLVDDTAAIRRVLANGSRRMAVHCEDETRLLERRALIEGADVTVALHPVWRDEQVALRSTQRLLDLAAECRRPVHVLHVTTAQEAELLARHKALASMECTPQHLTLFAPDAYEQLGSYAQMNPPIRGIEHQRALWRAVEQGVVDVLGSDHAPHTREEKDRPYPRSPSGMPGVQTMLPLMLDAVNAGKLSLLRLVDLLCHGPQRLFGIAAKGRLVVGYDADLTIVDLKARRRIEARWIASRCGWTPFDGREVTGWPRRTIVRGQTVMADDELVGAPGLGQAVRFQIPQGS
ncbi:MAG: dihydroorotase [Deltaproteobacteria bacterium]|nr:dihydroorotase [Deltaproteobacteria bacterium]